MYIQLLNDIFFKAKIPLWVTINIEIRIEWGR